MANRQILPNTSTAGYRSGNQNMINEVNLRPDFDSVFSSNLPGVQNTYGEFNSNGEEFYTPSIGSFFVDCSLLLDKGDGKPPSLQQPVLVEVPLIEGGFGRFSTSSFTPAEYGVSSSVPNQQSYKSVFNDNINNTRFQRNSIDLTYTVINNGYKEGATPFDSRTSPKHKQILATWNAYGMNTMTTDADGNVVLPEDTEMNIMTHSHKIAGFDLTSGPPADPDFNFGGLNNDFYQTADPYAGEFTYGQGYAQYLTILDSELWYYPGASVNVGNVIFNTTSVNQPHFFGPRVMASSRINPGPDYIQLTPVFQFFITRPHLFIKGIYRIY